MEDSPMARPPVKDLTERELEVMHVFWKHREAAAAEARDHLAAAGRDRSYPTVANLVRILLEKGFLEQVTGERPFRYRPVRSYEDVSGRLLGDLIQRVFRGSPSTWPTSVYGFAPYRWANPDARPGSLSQTATKFLYNANALFIGLCCHP
jgi:predicted transcriptional regulator